MNYIIWPEDGVEHAHIGRKAKALLELRGLELPIPPWFVITPEAFYASLSEPQKAAINHEDPERLQQVARTVTLAEPIRTELERSLQRLCPQGQRVAVRASALEGDRRPHSQAESLASFLFVDPSQVVDKILAVWQSGFTQHAWVGPREGGRADRPQPSAVLIQRMVNADVSGTASGADPVSGRRSAVVASAVYGAGTSIDTGEAQADTYVVDRQQAIIRRQIANKRTACRTASEGSEGPQTEAVSPEKAILPALTDEQVQAVTALVRQVSHHFGRPQEISWAIEAGTLHLLQSRPIASIGLLPDPDGVVRIWDSRSLAEGLGGVASPLTFTFVREVYEEGYRQFCRLMGVPEQTISHHRNTFANMLGLIQGRIYCNLLNWYRVVTMLPGFAIKRPLIEQLMGVKEEVPKEILAETPLPLSRGQRWQERFRLARAAGSLLLAHLGINRRIEEFRHRLDQTINHIDVPLEDQRIDELGAHYRQLEKQLLTRWDVPLLNDSLAAIFYSALRRLSQKWLGDADGTLQNSLLCGESGAAGTESIRRMRELAEIAIHHPAFVQALCDAPRNVIEQQMPGAFREPYREYLHTFGDRRPEELKLESPTLREDPLPLLRSIGQLAHHRHGSPSVTRSEGDETQIRRAAEERAAATLQRRSLRRIAFWWVLHNTRQRLRDRENLRFEQTRVLGRIRQLFLEIGNRLHVLDLLDDPRDVFYLEVEEILGFIEGTATCTDLRSLAEIRKIESDRYRDLSPDERFDTVGAVYQGNLFRSQHPQATEGGEERKGLGCCAGIVRGRVRVVTNPREAKIKQGEILVAARTDPGWILLFALAAGAIIEQGDPLSQSAIMARGMGIPAVVNLPGASMWLRDGDMVELDGGTGTVKRLTEAGMPAKAR